LDVKKVFHDKILLIVLAVLLDLPGDVHEDCRGGPASISYHPICIPIGHVPQCCLGATTTDNHILPVAKFATLVALVSTKQYQAIIISSIWNSCQAWRRSGRWILLRCQLDGVLLPCIQIQAK
jgi:hypothetical protein